MNKLNGSLAILVAALCYGSYGVFGNIIGGSFDIFFQTYARAIIAWLIIVVIVLVFKLWKKIESRSDLNILLYISAFGVLTQAIYYAYQTIGIGLGSIFYFFAILVVQFVMGSLLYKEKISLVKIVSVVLAFVGIYLIFSNDIQGFEPLGIIAAIASGFAVGGQAALTKMVSGKYSGWQISLFSWFLVIVACLPLSLMFNETQVIPSFDMSWFYLVVFAIIGLLVFPLLIYGYKRIDVSLGGIISLIEIPAAIWFGYIFFDEQVTPTIMLGAAIILLSAALPDFYSIVKKKN